MLSGPLKGEKIPSSSLASINYIGTLNRHKASSIEGQVNKLWDLDTLGIRKEDEAKSLLLSICLSQEKGTLLNCLGRQIMVLYL